MTPLTVAIAGLGLLGTSLGMALRDCGCRRIGWTRNRTNLCRAVEENVIDDFSDTLETAAAQSDITILCLPVTEIIKWIPKLGGVIRPEAILTDVGSAKGLIMAHAETEFKSAGFFIGSHPMAGTEYSGYDAAVESLYRHAPVFITPAAGVPRHAVETLCHFWRGIGADPTPVSSALHDRIVAHTSHLSHLLAATLVRTALDFPENEHPLWYDGCAGGFRDTTRIASSSAAMWRTIIEQNREEVLKAMDHFIEKWSQMRHQIENHDFDAFEQLFAEGHNRRAEWLAYRIEKNNVSAFKSE